MQLLSNEDRKLALQWLTRDIDVITVAQHFGISVESLKAQLNNVGKFSVVDSDNNVLLSDASYNTAINYCDTHSEKHLMICNSKNIIVYDTEVA